MTDNAEIENKGKGLFGSRLSVQNVITLAVITLPVVVFYFSDQQEQESRISVLESRSNSQDVRLTEIKQDVRANGAKLDKLILQFVRRK